MIHNVFLTFHGNNLIATQKQLFSNIKNTFTIEFWAKPSAHHSVPTESNKGMTGAANQRFAITPVSGAYDNGNHHTAGVGVSVGMNGISIVEHTTNHLPATLVYEASY